jgi:hypothetical protein
MLQPKNINEENPTVLHVGINLVEVFWIYLWSSSGVHTIEGGAAFEPHAAMKSLIVGIATMKPRYPPSKRFMFFLHGIGSSSVCAMVFLSSCTSDSGSYLQ